MRLSAVGRFLLVALAGLLCLMPVWYYFSSVLAAPVFFLAGESASAVFHWALSYERKETVGVLRTVLKVVSVQDGQFKSGKLAPLVDYRLLGYGIVIFWALLLASLPIVVLRVTVELTADQLVAKLVLSSTPPSLA